MRPKKVIFVFILYSINEEPEILWLIRDLFIDEYNVITIDNISGAYKILDDVHPDIILCDTTLSNIDKIAFVRHIKENTEISHIPLVLISANHEIEKQVEGIDLGAELYLTKPFNPDYLKTSVKQIIKRKQKLKDYFSSSKSAYELVQGKLKHREHKLFIKRILDIIDTNIMDKELSVEFIAKKMEMNTRNLYRITNRIGDISVSDMIRECRLQKACDLLKKTEFTIEEVIYKSGFTNRVSFFKLFSKKYGCTPKEFRKQHMHINL